MGYRRPTDDEIMRALCCGGRCEAEPFPFFCHRWDFQTEVARIRTLLNRMEETRDEKANEDQESEETGV